MNRILSLSGRPDIISEPGCYCIDTHIHTLFSRCSISQPMDVLLRANKIGLSGVAIMDHNNSEGATNATDCAEYLKDRGLLPEDFIVIPGQEVNTTSGHVGILFSLKKYPTNESPESLAARVHDDGGLVVAVHPFHSTGIGDKILDTPLDIVEIDCGAVFDNVSADKVRQYFSSNKLDGVAAVGSSDAHYINAIGMCYTLVRDSKPSLQGVRQAILAGKTESRRSRAHQKWTQCFGKIKKLK